MFFNWARGVIYCAWIGWNHICIGYDLPYWRCVHQRPLNEGEHEPDIAQAEECPCDDAQFPGAFTPAEHLRYTIPGHGENHQYPEPPGDTRETFLAQDKDEAPQEHRRIDGEVAPAETKLVPEDVERV